jgi:hypothetical protein
MKNTLAIIVICTVIASFYYLKSGMPLDMAAPYPDSPVISDVEIDWSTHIKKAPGSDNWPVTWADDNHQYSSWGDGGGFNGSNKRGRVSLGFARIEGDSKSEGTEDPFKGVNIIGGFQPHRASSIVGKSYGILSIEDTLYAWVSPGSGPEGYREARLYKSLDHARSWEPLTWSFSIEDRFIFPTFLQFGKNYSGPNDNYVYVYASILQRDVDLLVQKPGLIALLRVPVNSITDRNKYEVFTGLNENGLPEWSKNVAEWQPVFNDPNGVGWNVSASYNPGLNRYFLITEHYATSEGYIGIFDSSTPWGPWTTSYYSNLGSFYGISSFYYNFSNKWLSQDGKRFVLVFSGIGEYDAYNSVNGKFIIHE